MKFKSLLLLLLAALLTLAIPRSARAADISFEFFYDSLSPYGEWIEVGDYGYCWRPAGVDEDWAPYADGYWTYTDAGWTWVSYEDFGGIVYHYGRWVKLEDEGWCWVPDYEWGPAWVSWRRSDDYVGWAPLPAEAHWHRDRGFSVWVDTSYDIGPSYYNFCRFHDFGAPVLRHVLLRRSENFVILGNTVNITNITYNTRAGCVFNGGLEYAYVNRFIPRPIPALKLVRNTNITVVNNTIINNNVRVTNFNAVQRGNQLTVLAPNLVKAQPQQVAALLQPKVTKVIPQQKVTKGWGSLTAEQRNTIKAKFAKETEGKVPENAPAKPVTAAELKVVPVKADPKAKIAGMPPKPSGPKTPPEPGPVATPKPEAITKLPAGTPVPGATETVRTPGGKVIAKKPGKFATPTPETPKTVTENPPAGTVIPGVTTPQPITKTPGKPGRNPLVKPFNPKGDDTPDVPTTPGTVKKVSPVPPTDAIEKRNAAAEAAAKRNAAADAAKQNAAAQAAARQRAMEQNQQQQEALRLNKAQEAAAAKKKMIQQQDVQEQNAQNAARKRAMEQQQQQQIQMQKQNNEQQQILRERAAQAAQARQRSAEMQQQQSQAAARQKALENAAAARQRVPQVQQQNVPPGNVQRVVPGKPGKKPLTPEEAARLQQLR